MRHRLQRRCVRQKRKPLNNWHRQKPKRRQKNGKELQKAAQAEKDALAAQQAALGAQAAEELKQAEAKHAQKLAETAATLEAEKRQELEREAQAQAASLAEHQAALEKQAAGELRQAEKEHAVQLARAEKELDKTKAIAAGAVKAAEAREQIVDLLTENFKDYDSSAVEIDEKTGKVRLNFQESYFERGFDDLSEDMKEFLRIMIPKYAKSIYENENAAEMVESLKISGMTSPVYMGVYIDINDTSPRSEKARQYNMALSNRRAVAMYNFIFDENEMGNYQYHTKLKKDMGIAALGFQEAKPVGVDLVGKDADCIEYNCKNEQATILQFQLYTEDLASF